MRQCGECFACCVAAEVQFETYAKPARKTCLHVIPSEHKQKGRCGIFGQPCRPSACSGFECAWLQGTGFDSHRPDMTGIMLSVNNLNGGIWGFAVELEPGALLGKGSEAVVEFAKTIPMPIIVASYERLPPHDFGDRVVVKDSLLTRSKQLIGTQLAILTDEVRVYELYDQKKGGIA